MSRGTGSPLAARELGEPVLHERQVLGPGLFLSVLEHHEPLAVCRKDGQLHDGLLRQDSDLEGTGRVWGAAPAVLAFMPAKHEHDR